MYFQELSKDLARMCNEGIKAKDNKIYKIYIGGIYADFLARAKLFKCNG